MALLGRSWNGRYGRLARRDIWLHREQTWRVEARQGDGDSAVWSHDYPTEAEARDAISGMINRTGGRNEWKQLPSEPAKRRTVGREGRCHRPPRGARRCRPHHDH
jgi:hypothetical protein